MAGQPPGCSRPRCGCGGLPRLLGGKEGSGCHRGKGRGVEVSPQTSVAARSRLVLGLLLAGTSAWVRVSYSKQGGIAAQQFGCFEI